ncbi:MAG: peptidoglycan DD-metalloendopeptidase family protein [Oleiphilaceae bacterium]|nr:peptidoglycan DD-metalloendopeptidase family protein [Oleiphilaceae bacterium]
MNATRTTIPLELNENVPELADEIKMVNQSNEATIATAHSPEPKQEDHWQHFTIKSGDTLSNLFQRAGYNDKIMYQVLGNNARKHELTRLFPGEELSFSTNENGKLLKIKLQRNPLEHYEFVRADDDSFSEQKHTREPDVHIAYAEGVIDSSLFLAGQKAGLTQAQIMELANIFGWDIDFVLDIREGDSFNLIYEELYLDGDKYKNGRILAATFTNQGRQIDAVLYEQENGFSHYFTPDGNSMRKAFLRTPVDFARISSHFNLKRKHPILHKIRAHKGTDYAAARGTPIKAAGDGKVIHAARKGGYGKTVIIQHGQAITTLYAHMSKYAKGIRKGARVKQGQVIGYIGSTGLASGPHLHYEFRVNGVHKNPVRVKLPQAQPIPKQQLADFKKKTGVFLSQLQTFRESYQLASSN